MMRKGLLSAMIMCSLLSVASVHAAALVWEKSQANAFAKALDEGKLVILVAGGCDESNTLYMRDTVFEDPSVVVFVDDHFVPWFCDTHASSEWVSYRDGLTQLTMPLICRIDPVADGGLVDFATGLLSAAELRTWLEGPPPAEAPGYGGGSGEPSDPYRLNTAEHIETLANYREHWDKYFVLTQDVDMQSNLLVGPIGNSEAPFTGVFDGSDFCIKNLVFEDTLGEGPVGLFGDVDFGDANAPGLIRNLRLIAPVVTTDAAVDIGALVGRLETAATLWQCSVEGGLVQAWSGSSPAGGLVGTSAGQVGQCYSTAAVVAEDVGGGLIGWAEPNGVVYDCVAAGPVTAWANIGVAGGLVGYDDGGSLVHCFANSPSIRGGLVGGVIGQASLTACAVCDGCVSNMAAATAIGNQADTPGCAWCEPLANLANEALFWVNQWDLIDVWYVDDWPRLRWMSELGVTGSDPAPVPVAVDEVAAQAAASPATIGRTGQIEDVKFYVLLPAGRSVAEVDTASPIYLDAGEQTIQMWRDASYAHKQQTVVATVSTAQLLATMADGATSAGVSIPLKTGQYVFGVVDIQIIAGYGRNPVDVSLDRFFNYYLNSDPWR
jgi:hypothetical protein